MNYEGAYNSNGRYDGYGKLYNECEQLIYKGFFADGLFNGSGTSLAFWYDFGIMFEGNFYNGKLDGRGTQYARLRPDCEVSEICIIYRGNYIEGRRNGNGTLYYQPGDPIYSYGMSLTEYHLLVNKVKPSDYKANLKRYEGEFLLGEPTGVGRVFTYPKEELFYEGEFLRGAFNGQGKAYQAPNEPLYSGEWLLNKFDGYGTKFGYKGEVVKRGFWEAGSFKK